MDDKPDKSNIQCFEIHLVIMSNNGRRADHESLGRRQTVGASALPTDPEKGRADK